jgi:hypothetical protein
MDDQGRFHHALPSFWAMPRGELRTDFRNAQLFMSNTFQLIPLVVGDRLVDPDDNTYTSRSGPVSQLKTDLAC